MKIEILIEVDERSQKLFWSSKVTEGDNVVLQVVSQLFDPRDETDFQMKYENVTSKTMKEIKKLGSPSSIIKLFILQS